MFLTVQVSVSWFGTVENSSWSFVDVILASTPVYFSSSFLTFLSLEVDAPLLRSMMVILRFSATFVYLLGNDC